MKFFLVTDMHYSDKPVGDNNRYHGESLKKLKYALENYAKGSEFIVCLGDIVDAFEGYKSQTQGLCELSEMLEEFPAPFYATFGNHDTALDKREFMRLTGMPDRYYSFETEEYLCLMLDSCMNSKSEPYPPEEILWQECVMDDEQILWLKEKVENSVKPVIIFTHIMLSPCGTDEVDHILNNAEEITDILIANEDKVAAVFSGHYHFGMTGKIGKIPYITFKALCMGEAITCAEVEIKDNKVIITGHGDELSQICEKQ